MDRRMHVPTRARASSTGRTLRSSSPLVALHFATADADSFDDDGVVWCINFIDAQFALFSLMSDAGASLDDWIAAHPRLCWRITVPAELKGELFPDLDGLSRWLERYYRPRQ